MSHVATPTLRPRRLSLPAGIAAAVALCLPSALSAQDDLEKCNAPVGTLAVVEPQREVLSRLSRYELESPSGVIRRMVQESNCFIVVERGVALNRLQQERELAQSGELTGDANVGGGQMQAADFYLTPDIVFSDDDAGGVGGAIGSRLGRAVGVVGGGLKFKEAHTSMLVAATRSGVQVASAEGEAKQTDFALGALTFIGGVAGGLGGYTSNDEGKVIMASFLENYNNIVTSVRENPNLPPLSPEEIRARVTGEAQAGTGFAEGDIVSPKIDNVEVYDAPSDGANVVTRVMRSDALVYLGAEENGYLQVQSSDGPGWIRKVLVNRQ
ncbi:MAG: CsgG/HfaB family protein [Gemmatimonadota bacterium]|jgi:curli biogenesis system outer membrane secretion channel CsgG